MADLEIFAGEDVNLSLLIEDGNTGLFPRVTLVEADGTLVPSGVVDLPHTTLGYYTDVFSGLTPGEYRGLYVIYDDASHIVESDYDRDMDTILVQPYDRPRLGVAYDDTADDLLFEAYLSKRGQQVASPELSTATIEVFDSDDNLLFPIITDLAPDSEGVFRFTHASPGLTADRLYNVKITINTTTGPVVGQQGFMVTE